MIAAIAGQELRGLLRDGRLWLLAIALAALSAAVLADAVQERDLIERERLQAQQAARAQWDGQGDKNPHRAAHFGLYAFKPRSVLAGLDAGVDAIAGQALWLEPHKRNMALFAPAADAVPATGLGGLTPAFVLFALVPLLIAVLGHASVTQERERGTLRMLQASGVRSLPLLAGKWLGLCAGTALALLPAAAAAGWLLAGAGAAASWLGAALLLYYATWAALTVLLSTLARSSRAALLGLAALWAAWVFAWPPMAATAVAQHAPLPTGDAFWKAIGHDIEHGLPGDPPAAARMKAFDAALLARHGAARPDDLPIGANAARRLFRDAYATRVHALHFERLWQAQQRQESLLRLLGAVGPYAAARSVGSALAGTDMAHRRHFEEAAEDYRQTFTTWLDDWDLRATRGVTSFESRYAGRAQWQALPDWHYAAPGIGFALRESRSDWGLMAAWLLAALGGLALAARRLRP